MSRGRRSDVVFPIVSLAIHSGAYSRDAGRHPSGGLRRLSSTREVSGRVRIACGRCRDEGESLESIRVQDQRRGGRGADEARGRASGRGSEGQLMFGWICATTHPASRADLPGCAVVAHARGQLLDTGSLEIIYCSTVWQAIDTDMRSSLE